MQRRQIEIENNQRRMLPFDLARDTQTGKPMWSSHLLPPVAISTFGNTEEARYSSTVPGVGGVFAQNNLSGGLGKKLQVRPEHADANRYYYGEWFDASVPGQAQKGPAITTLTAPANSGAMTSAFDLAGTCYLILGRKIVSWGGTGSDVLTEVRDYTAGLVGSGSATFLKLGAAASIEASTGTGATGDIQSSDDMVAQQFRLDDTNVLFLSHVVAKLIRTGTVTGDARMRIFTDINGAPGTELASARTLAAQIDTAAEDITFRFEDSDLVALPYNEPMWLVLDVASATVTNYVQWIRGTVTSYARGAAYRSVDGGNTWNAFSDFDANFAVWAKTATTTAYVGATSASKFLATTTNGTAYTDDTYRTASQFCVIGDVLVRDVLTAGANGAIETSEDGTNWSEATPIGDVTVPITNLLNLSSVLIVCKEDSIWAVDLDDLTVIQLSGRGRVTTNGQGATVWKDTAYVPFGGRLVAITGGFDAGFTVYSDVSHAAIPEWDAPWGQGRVVAVAGDRFHLYAAVSATSGYRLLKAADPLRQVDDKPSPDWHGSLATLGDGTQTIQYMTVFDIGGTTNPELFFTTTSNNVGRIRLPRSANPASDPNYSYDITTPGDLFFPHATGNYPVHPKGWYTESITFQQSRASDYTEFLFDDRDGSGFRRLPKGRLYDTGVLPYPPGESSRVLARQLRLVNSAATASPLILAVGVSYAVRHIKGATMRELSFTIEADDGLSASTLGDMFGIGATTTQSVLADAAGGGAGTRRFRDPYGRVYERVQFLDATDTMQDDNRALIQVSAVAVT